jgi:hypothetical protein
MKISMNCINTVKFKVHKSEVYEYIYIYIFIYLCVCVCVFVSVYVCHVLPFVAVDGSVTFRRVTRANSSFIGILNYLHTSSYIHRNLLVGYSLKIQRKYLSVLYTSVTSCKLVNFSLSHSYWL